jgi:dGTPase
MGDEAEGFEGNAQSFRIVSELAFRSNEFRGLNLTRATLSAILKYPWTYARRPKENHKKWGAYQSEIDSFKHATGNGDGDPMPPCTESRLMDWADDLTYSVHDVEDFYRAGLIPLHLLRPAIDPNKSADPERNRFLEYAWSRRETVKELKELKQDELDRKFTEIMAAHFSIENAYDGTREQRARLRFFTSILVNRYINGLSLTTDGEKIDLRIDEDKRKELAILKQLTWCYVIESPGLAVQQHAQKQAIRYLFGVFRHEVTRSPSNLLPPYYQQRLKDIRDHEGPGGGPHSKRLVCDLIAGMTEHQATGLYQRLNGISLASGLDNIIV